MVNHKPALSIIMPCYNRAHDLQRALEAYDRQRGDEPFELITVDDASTDETHLALSSYHPNCYTLRVERLPQNSGPAAARNRGIELAQAPVVLFVGDDILPHPDLVRGHLAAHRHYHNPGTAILGRINWPSDLPVNTLMAHIDGIGAQQFSYHFMRDGQEYDFRHFYTANVSIKRDLLFSLDHWFDTDFKYAALEDAELAYRLSKRGMRIIYTSLLVGYHYHYHTIWSFSERQRKAGLMANVLTYKHPELTGIIKGKKWLLKSKKWQLIALFQPDQFGKSEWLERHLLHAVSNFEWQPNQMLDSFYIKLLNYFYLKGLITDSFRDAGLSKRILGRFALQQLTPLLAKFSHESEDTGINRFNSYANRRKSLEDKKWDKRRFA